MRERQRERDKERERERDRERENRGQLYAQVPLALVANGEMRLWHLFQFLYFMIVNADKSPIDILP